MMRKGEDREGFELRDNEVRVCHESLVQGEYEKTMNKDGESEKSDVVEGNESRGR